MFYLPLLRGKLAKISRRRPISLFSGSLLGTEYEGLPVLSAGHLSKPVVAVVLNTSQTLQRVKSQFATADLYIYPNTARLVKLTGAQVKEWLECSATQFNAIDPGSSEV